MSAEFVSPPSGFRLAVYKIVNGLLVHPNPKSETLEREFFIDNLLVRIHFIIVMMRWTGLAPWEIEFPFPGSLTSTFPDPKP